MMMNQYKAVFLSFSGFLIENCIVLINSVSNYNELYRFENFSKDFIFITVKLIKYICSSRLLCSIRKFVDIYLF
jgi:hypothetical protein